MPELEAVLHRLSRLIDTRIMQAQNNRVDQKHLRPRDVARQFLELNGLLEGV